MSPTPQPASARLRGRRESQLTRSCIHGRDRYRANAELGDPVHGIADEDTTGKSRPAAVVEAGTQRDQQITALQRGEKIELRGFGSFRLRRREPRKGRNPKTGDKVDVPPKKVPYFKPGKELKELINREPEPVPAAPASETAPL